MKKRAFTLLEVMIVVLIIGILISIAIPQMMTARANSAKKTCHSNLRIFDAVKAQYAMEENKPNETPVVLDDLLPYLRRVPECPLDGTYDLTTVGANSSCSIPEHVHPDG